jgi:hypothetical protein
LTKDLKEVIIFSSTSTTVVCFDFFGPAATVSVLPFLFSPGTNKRQIRKTRKNLDKDIENKEA